MTDSINLKYNKMDLHMHPRPSCFNLNTLLSYAKLACLYGFDVIGFLEHGIRFSNNHDSILKNKHDIYVFHNMCREIEKGLSLKIYAGIEIDYYAELDNNHEYKCYLEEINNSEIDYIVGSVHGYGKKNNPRISLCNIRFDIQLQHIYFRAFSFV